MKELIGDSKSELSDCAGLETSIMKYIYEFGSEQNADVSVKLAFTEGDMRYLNIHKDYLSILWNYIGKSKPFYYRKYFHAIDFQFFVVSVNIVFYCN